MPYIPFKVLKLLAMILHAFYSLIYPKYSKHGQRKMTIPQKLTLITIAQAFGFTYRDIPLIAEDLRDILKLRRITTFQNFNDFANRIKPREIQEAIEFSAAIIIRLSNTKERIILIDSTGFQIMDASSYYNHRAQKAADFFKLHVVMDLATRAIILATPSDRYYHDSNPLKSYFIDELAKLSRELGFRIKVVSADSAYSSNEVYKRIKEELRAIPAIKPSKGCGNPRRGLKALFWRIRNLPWFRRYANLRWVLEAMFKVFKRLFGWFVRGKSQESRANEVLFKALAWNIMLLLIALASRVT